MRTLQIQVHDGPHKTAWRPIQAHILNKFFAAHHYVWSNGELDDSRWTLTHVPSGLSMGQQYYYLRDARAIAEELIALPIDWSLPGKIKLGKHTDTVHSILLERG